MSGHPGGPVRIERVAAPTTFPLRQAVLRPHQAVEAMALPGDDDEDAAHLAGLDGSGRVVATASVRREAPPFGEPGPAWRLRGMAVAEGWRGRGLGGRLVGAVVDHVAAQGGGLLWCQARLPAVAFYERAGFTPQGDPAEIPGIGPHVPMARRVP